MRVNCITTSLLVIYACATQDGLLCIKLLQISVAIHYLRHKNCVDLKIKSQSVICIPTVVVQAICERQIQESQNFSFEIKREEKKRIVAYIGAFSRVVLFALLFLCEFLACTVLD